MAILNSATCINAARIHDSLVNRTLCTATAGNGKAPVSFLFPLPTLYPQHDERVRRPDGDKQSAIGQWAGRPMSWSGSPSRMSSSRSIFRTSRVGN